MSKENSYQHISNFLKQELFLACKDCSAQRVVELENCIHHLRVLHNDVKSIGKYKIVDQKVCNTWNEVEDYYVVQVDNKTYKNYDIGDELHTGYDIEDAVILEENKFFLVRYVGE